MSRERYGGEIICPHCGYEYSDSWDFNFENGRTEEIECDDCGKEFCVEKNVIVNYRTWVEEEQNG